VTLTLDTYSHIIPGLQELATRKLEEALFDRIDKESKDDG
jgi:hypothetical protein